MQIIVEKETNLSIAMFQDVDTVTIGSSELNASDSYGITYIYKFLNSSNATLHENVITPDDWVSGKYTFDGEAWALNQDWIDPA